MKAKFLLAGLTAVVLSATLVGCGKGGSADATKPAGSVEAAKPSGINGSGATFPAPVYTKWASDYKGATGVAINYQGTGSSAGIDAIKKKTVDFGATDAPLSGADLDAAGLVQFPAVIGGVVPVYNIEGVGALTLDGAVLGDIYLMKIKKWNDAAIVKLNPGVKLPDTEIKVVRRSDGSGTTFMFTDYLAQVNEGWKAIGASKEPKWVDGTVGGKGNDGVAASVKQLPGAIGYVEYAYAKKNGMAAASLVNKDGKVVAPTAEAFAAAAVAADWTKAPGMGISLNNEPGAKSWPITGATFILLPKKTDNAQSTADVLKFFDWALSKGQAQASALEYIPLPDALVVKIKESWKVIADASGKPVL
jgi:phosphate transport system substrate-binding protein